MNEMDRTKLVNELYLVHCDIFDGVSKDDFANYVVYSKARQTRILIHKNDQGQSVGYCAIHFFEQELEGKASTVIRMEAGLMRAYRGKNRNAPFVCRQVMGYRLTHPGRNVYYLGALVHPSSYMLLDKYATKVWPSAEQSTELDYGGVIRQLTRLFGLKAVDPDRPGVVHVGWQTRDNERDRKQWQANPNQAAQFYIHRNPGYSQGHGLLTLVPVTIGCVAHATGRMLLNKLGNLFAPHPHGSRG
ncbi:hypothetical protein DK843_02460 [Chromobacterium phragmitis]|uniref:Uncharacterized protein n=2 Tax=Chromobacterium phragmitis TaxID=2202141 RepID=A0A344UDC7_9NEIS|nr:hypothetical protein DK843_02460 [Chromobacterium phragmitis]